MLPSVHSVGIVTVAVVLGVPAIGGLSVGTGRAALASDCCQSSTLAAEAVLGDPDPGDDPDFPFGDPPGGSADTGQTISQEVSQLVSQVLSEVLPQATGQQPAAQQQAPAVQQQAPAVQQQAPAVQQQAPAVQQSSPPTQAGGVTAVVGRRTQATGQSVSWPRPAVKRVVHRAHAAPAAVRPREVTASAQRHQPATELNTRLAQPWRSASAAPTRRAVTASPAPLALLREPPRLARWVAFVASACVLVVGVLLLAGARAKRRILKL